MSAVVTSQWFYSSTGRLNLSKADSKYGECIAAVTVIDIQTYVM